jgi:hypothetical protein
MVTRSYADRYLKICITGIVAGAAHSPSQWRSEIKHLGGLLSNEAARTAKKEYRCCNFNVSPSHVTAKSGFLLVMSPIVMTRQSCCCLDLKWLFARLHMLSESNLKLCCTAGNCFKVHYISHHGACSLAGILESLRQIQSQAKMFKSHAYRATAFPRPRESFSTSVTPVPSFDRFRGIL